MAKSRTKAGATAAEPPSPAPEPAQPAASEPELFDAALVPNGWPTGGGEGFEAMHAMLKARNDQLGPAFGVKQVFSRNTVRGWLVSRDRDDTLLFPHGHPRQGEDRYTWSDPDERGVRLGKLTA